MNTNIIVKMPFVDIIYMEELKQFLVRIQSVKQLRNSIAKSDTVSRKTSRLLHGYYVDSPFVKKYSEEIIKYLGNKFNSRIIGFSIFVKKFRKEQVE